MALDYLLTYAGVPFVGDASTLVRMVHKHAEMETPEHLPPLKHQPMEDLIDELDKRMPFGYLQDFSLPAGYPGRNTGALANTQNPDPQPNPEVHIGDYYYPYGAGRFSVFRGLATSSQVKAMLAATTGINRSLSTAPQGPILTTIQQAATPVPTSGISSALFVMQQSPISPSNPGNSAPAFTVATNLFMLPPRPLAENAGGLDGLFLITLVDERFYFQATPVSFKISRSTTWGNLIDAIAAVLNISIAYGPIPAVYGTPEPDSQFWANQENAPFLLDAVAANIGQVVVRNFDGTYVLQTPLQSGTIVAANRGNALQVVRSAGGDIFSTVAGLPAGDLTAAKNSIVPANIVVTFPKYVQGDDPVPHFYDPRSLPPRSSSWFRESYGDVYSITVPISQGGAQVAGLTGISENYLHTTAKALYNSEADAAANPPLNLSSLNALAMQLAQDLWNAKVASALDEVYPGIVAWTPEGIHDIIWTYSEKSRQACTRVMRAEWNTNPCEFQHATPPPAGSPPAPPRGASGMPVAQTIRDSFAGIVVTTLASAMAVGDLVASFASVGNFPTQNRWKGRIDQETVLFEGTVGFAAGVVVAYRGIDGTVAAAHALGATVTQVAPDAAYGVNLVTYEKGQYVYPSVQNNGVAGVNVVPQTQSVACVSTNFTVLNGISHYPGFLYLYDATGIAGSPWASQEAVWLVDRNGLTPVLSRIYDGQFVGWSPAPAQPVYAISEVTPVPPPIKHNLLDANIDQDTKAANAAQGAFIYGNGNKWDSFAPNASSILMFLAEVNSTPSWMPINTAAFGPHNLLDANIDQDTAAAPPAYGAIVIGNSSTKWDAFPPNVSGINKFLTEINSTPSWAAIQWGDINNIFYANFYTTVNYTILLANLGHNLLSPPHLDTLVDNVVSGDLMIGGTGPLWKRLPGNNTATRKFAMSQNTQPVIWDQVKYSDLIGAPGSIWPPTLAFADRQVSGASSTTISSINITVPDGYLLVVSVVSQYTVHGSATTATWNGQTMQSGGDYFVGSGQNASKFHIFGDGTTGAVVVTFPTASANTAMICEIIGPMVQNLYGAATQATDGTGHASQTVTVTPIAGRMVYHLMIAENCPVTQDGGVDGGTSNLSFTSTLPTNSGLGAITDNLHTTGNAFVKLGTAWCYINNGLISNPFNVTVGNMTPKPQIFNANTYH